MLYILLWMSFLLGCTLTRAMELSELVLNSGKRIPLNSIDAKGNTALHHACKAHDVQAVRTLLLHGADLTAVTHRGNTPLHTLCKSAPGSKARRTIMRMLLKAQADPNATNILGQTPLHLAVTAWHTSGIELLIKRGAKINATDADGATPLAYAFISEAPVHTITQLLHSGASIPHHPLPIPQHTNMSWQYRSPEGFTLFHYNAHQQDTALRELIRSRRTLSAQDWQSLLTVLLVHKYYKMFGQVPKVVLVQHILPHCFDNFLYVYGTVKERVDWHCAQLFNYFSHKSTGGEIPYDVSPGKSKLLIPTKVNQQHRKKIERNYLKAQVRK